MPCMESASRSGMPASAMVGTSGSVGEPLGAGDRERAQLAVLDERSPRCRQRRERRSAYGRRSSTVIAGPPPLNGTCTRSSAELELEQLADQLRLVPAPGRGEAVLAGVGLHQRDQLLHVLRRERRMHRQHVRPDADQRDRREVLARVVGHLAVEARVEREARRREQDGVAVGRRAARPAPMPMLLAGAGDVLDVELLAPASPRASARSCARSRRSAPPAANGTMIVHRLASDSCCAARRRRKREQPRDRSCRRASAWRWRHAILRSPIRCVRRSAAQIFGILASLDHLLPLGDLGLDVGRELGRRIAFRHRRRSPAASALISGEFTIVAISFCSRSTIAFGVPAGTNTPVMVSASWSLMPISSSVGMSGSVSERFLAVTPSARILPSLISVDRVADARRRRSACGRRAAIASSARRRRTAR